jgi:Holliday junction DNA helicase RuvB
LRPQRLTEFIGQQQARSNLAVFIEAARARREPLDHVLFVGPPGLGKTTLAQIVARELGVSFRATSGPVIAKAGDLAALLTNLEERDVLFSEVRQLSGGEITYPAMEDFQLDISLVRPRAVRQIDPGIRWSAPPRAGSPQPLRDRLVSLRLNFYSGGAQGVNPRARVLGIGLAPDGQRDRARARTPAIAGRLLRKRVRDCASRGST